PLTSVSISPDGETVAFTAPEKSGKIRLWQVKGKAVEITPSIGEFLIVAVRFHPVKNDELLATFFTNLTGMSTTIADRQGKRAFTFVGNQIVLDFANEGKALLTFAEGPDGVDLRMWDYERRKMVSQMRLPKDSTPRGVF